MPVNATPPQRWSPVSVLSRWGFLLWLTPLLALLTSLIWHLLEFRRDSVTAVVQIRPLRSGSLFDFSARVRSPEVLTAVAGEMELPARWRTSQAEAALRLEPFVSCDLITGTQLFVVEISKSPPVDSQALCESILKHAMADCRDKLKRAREADATARDEMGCVLLDDPVIIHEGPSRRITSWSERLHDFRDSAVPFFWGSLLLALGLAYLAEALEPRRPADEALVVS